MPIKYFSENLENWKTFGIRLKYARIEARVARDEERISQTQLAGLLKTNANIIGNYEAGRVRPSIEKLQSLIKALNPSYPEEIYWRGLLGYLPPMQVPSKKQIVDTLEIFVKDLEAFPYPAYIVDYKFTYWLVNKNVSILLKSQKWVEDIMKGYADVFKIVFDSAIYKDKKFPILEDMVEVQRDQVRRFILRNVNRRHELFFQKYPNDLGKNYELSSEDFKHFKNLWHETEDEVIETKNWTETTKRAALGYMTILSEDKSKIEFQLTAEPILYLDGLFEVIRWYPAQSKDNDIVAKYFTSYSSPANESIRLWQIAHSNIDNYLRT